MNSEPIITHVTPVGGNIFADLGFEPDEATALLAETDAIISELSGSQPSLSIISSFAGAAPHGNPTP